MADTYWGQSPETLTVSASPTPTATNFTVSSATNLLVNQYILVQVSSALQRAQITAKAGNALTVTGLTGAPDTPGAVHSGRQLLKNDLLNVGAVFNADDVADLKTVPTTSAPAGLKYLLADSDRMYRLDPASSAAADDVTVIAPTTGPGRWLLISNANDNGLGGSIFLVDPNHPSAYDRSHDTPATGNSRAPFVTVNSAASFFGSSDQSIAGGILQIAPGDYTSEGYVGIYLDAGSATIEGLAFGRPMIGTVAALKDQVRLSDLFLQLPVASGTPYQVVVRNLTVASLMLQNHGAGDFLGSNPAHYVFENLQFSGGSNAGEAVLLLNGHKTTEITDLYGYKATFKGCGFFGQLWYEQEYGGDGPRPQNITFTFEDCIFNSATLPMGTSGMTCLFRNCVFFGDFHFGNATATFIFCAFENGITQDDSDVPSVVSCATSF